MIPWEHLATGAVPGGGELRLMRRGAEYVIRSGPFDLMNSRVGFSEAEQAVIACGRLRGRVRPSILIGGLGMGFTLRAALAALPPEAAVTMVELVPAVAEWARGPLAPVMAGALDDPRATLLVADVGATIRAATARFDAILLDVDNGPDGLTRPENDRLYGHVGLGEARRALRPGGILSVWSSGPDRAFSRRLRDAGFAVEEVTSRERKGKGVRHVVFLGTRR